MLELEIDLLTERYTASAYNDRQHGEWPPHPARLFSALVATWAEDEGPSPEAERAALEWLERQPPPRVVASGVGARTVVPVFVPVNDTVTVSPPETARAKLEEARQKLVEAQDEKARSKAQKALSHAMKKLRADTAKATAVAPATDEGRKKAGFVLPQTRLRQQRTFPTVLPHRPTVSYVWAESPPEPVREGLAALCRRLVALGHSSSLVRASVREAAGFEESEDSYTPDPHGQEVLRVAAEGQLARLAVAYDRHRGIEPRVLPAAFERYRKGPSRRRPPHRGSLFGEDWLVFLRTGGARYHLTRAVDVAETFRKALMKHGEDPLPEALTGHTVDGRRSERPHAAFVPLPWVGHEHATGSILGLALVLPAEMPAEARRAVMASIGRWEQLERADPLDETPELRLFNGPRLELRLRRVIGEPRAASLRSSTWCRSSRWWVTATPIALDRNPGKLFDEDLERRRRAFEEATETVRTSCLHVGLPEPEHVEIVTSTVLPGSTKPMRFPSFPSQRDKPRRVLVHARLGFSSPVRGPVLLGAGRYLGLGLCRPVDVQEAAR